MQDPHEVEMAPEAPSGLAVAGEVMPGEASTSALPAASTTEHATAAPQEPLGPAVPETSTGSSSRRSAALSRSLQPPLQHSEHPHQHPRMSRNLGDEAAANQLRRYISLLAETSTHTTALAHSIAPFKARRDFGTSTNGLLGSSLAFPPSLQAGAFRKGESAAPPSSWSDALQTLEALCSTLEHTASKLGLETFSDPAPEAAGEPTTPGPTGVLTRTLTLGAKILVIDVEFLLEGSSSAASLRPRIKLKLSYATDSADSQHVRDPRLGLVLETDIQTIADKLFGKDELGAIDQDRCTGCSSAGELDLQSHRPSRPGCPRG
ncbi:hypothetical protein L1887_48898 [Cichorium endivia]|nr:hypothetical protein L1887_48898 [Cichorium endivia]